MSELVAFKNKRTGKFVTGTEYTRDGILRQLYSKYHSPLIVWNDPRSVEVAMRCRNMSLEKFEVVEVEVKETDYMKSREK